MTLLTYISKDERIAVSSLISVLRSNQLLSVIFDILSGSDKMYTIAVEWSTNILSYSEALLTKQLSEIHSHLKWFSNSVCSP